MQKASRGRFGLDKANQIQDFAKNSFGILFASSIFSLIIKQYIEQLKNFESCIEIFDSEIAKIYDSFDCKLHTITGIGKTLAAVIFSEIGGDISKFESVPKLVAFAGLYPKNRQSGESLNSKGRLSKRGFFGVLFGLPLSKTLPSTNFMNVNAPKVKIISMLWNTFAINLFQLFLPSFAIITLMFLLKFQLDFS